MINSSDILNPVKKISNIIRPEDSHIWQFSRIGGVNRVNLLRGADLVALDNLDQKLWTALSCPVHGLEIDSKTLELIDSDHDDRIRVPEIKAAVKWVLSVVKNPDDLVRHNKSLPLDAINTDTEEGKNLHASAKQILANIGKPDKKDISVEETSDTVKIFAETQFNGDGIITQESVNEDELKKLIAHIIRCSGSAIDRNGKPGITADIITAFFTSCEEYSTWQSIAENNSKRILPFGDKTKEAQETFLAVKSKIDDYFLRHRLAEYDPSSSEVLNVLTSQYEAIHSKNLSSCTEEIALLPIAKVDAIKTLPLKENINPSWEKAMEVFCKQVVAILYPGKITLTYEEWKELSQIFNDFDQWIAEKKGTAVETLGLTEIRNILKDNKKDVLLSLIEQDNAMAKDANNIILVDRLVRYYRDLYSLLKNYVNFNDFYDPTIEAIFQAGSLYLDQRCCDLCMKVSNMPKHLSMAGASGICLLYCDCVSKKNNERMIIVVALTDGDIDNITVGRNAVFYDRKGNDWDATIIHILDNPISIRQAFWSPYKKFSKFISTQVEKLAASKDKEMETTVTSSLEKTTTKVDVGITESIKQTPASTPATPAQPPQPFDIGKFVGIFAAISMAFGAIGSVVVSALTGFFNLLWWEMPLALLGIMLAISLPSMVLAYLKLRKRNLAHVLDANGWAINARLTINIIFGQTLTHLAVLPLNSKVNLLDPFSKKRNPVWLIILVLVTVLGIAGYLLWHFGLLAKWYIFIFS